MEKNINMLQIPYIAHLARIHKAHKREKMLKVIIITSNALWGILFFATR